MEGARNERAMLVITAYIIGAVTAFIWASSGLSDNPTNSENLTLSMQTASLVMANPDVVDSIPGLTPVSNIITYEDGLLNATINGETKTLSYDPDLTGYEVNDEFIIQGVHYGEVVFKASDSGEYIFFCEVKTLGADFCSAFVYDSLTDVIYPLQRSGADAELSLAVAKAGAWNGNQLDFGAFKSANSLQPWVMNY